MYIVNAVTLTGLDYTFSSSDSRHGGGFFSYIPLIVNLSEHFVPPSLMFVLIKKILLLILLLFLQFSSIGSLKLCAFVMVVISAGTGLLV